MTKALVIMNIGKFIERELGKTPTIKEIAERINNENLSYNERLKVVKIVGEREAYGNVLEYMFKILKGEDK